ncbi:MAG TPA: hypothetical protein VES39_07420 [Rhodospirillales bacterium]|nr:hypothetical protein [Rhodospirillales bacterium]
MISIRDSVLTMLICLGGLALPMAASARDDCREPIEPLCISSRYSFEDELSAIRCKRETDHFLRETAEYVTCLERMKQVHLQLSSQTLSRLNCRLRGQLQC